MGIVLATSIPPAITRYEGEREVGQIYQKACIDSWVRAGFRVLSLNFSDEIPDLARRYPMVNFISVERDNSATLGRKTPLLADLLQVLSEQSESIVGIINADIALEAKEWTDVVTGATHDAIAVAHRLDVTSLGLNDPVSYRGGYDLFCFERKNIPFDMPRSFALGLPWWDFCLPVYFLLRGLRVNVLTSPFVFHLQHPMNYNASHWRYMGKEFAEFVLRFSVSSGSKKPDHFRPIIKFSRKVAAGPASYGDGPATFGATAWAKWQSIARLLPVVWRLAPDRGPDPDRRRLAETCITICG